MQSRCVLTASIHSWYTAAARQNVCTVADLLLFCPLPDKGWAGVVHDGPARPRLAVLTVAAGCGVIRDEAATGERTLMACLLGSCRSCLQYTRHA